MKTDYIPISHIAKMYPETDTTQENDPLCIIIKLKNGETWKTSYDIIFSKHGGGIEGDFEKSI